MKHNLVKSWLIVVLGYTIIILTAGHGVMGTWKGAFVDNRNTMSLSRFQILGWTILLLSSFTTIALWNIFATDHACLSDPTKGCLPGIPEELWLLMGISTASLVGSPLILDAKKKQTPDENEKNLTLMLLTQQGYSEDKLRNEGLLIANHSPEEARFSDLFTGEETGNFAYLDLARLQMFFFTVVSVVIYGVQVGARLSHESAQLIGDLPQISDGLIALIGISHTGYLASKGVSNSQTANETETSSSKAPLNNSSDSSGDDDQAVG